MVSSNKMPLVPTYSTTTRFQIPTKAEDICTLNLMYLILK